MTKFHEEIGVPLTDEDISPELRAIHRKWMECYRQGSYFWLRDALQAAYDLGRQDAADEVERLRAWLRDNGIHTESCLKFGEGHDTVKPCTCGLEQLARP